MKIEDFWKDISIYYIQFETKVSDEGTKRTIDKQIVLPIDYSKKQVEEVIYTYFKNVEHVTHIEYWDDGLILKNNKKSVKHLNIPNFFYKKKLND